VYRVPRGCYPKRGRSLTIKVILERCRAGRTHHATPGFCTISAVTMPNIP
jgi:hypothetical protein